jgi:SAM-dependent methyltransferase
VWDLVEKKVWKEWLADNLHPGCRVLDMGSGAGKMVDLMLSLGVAGEQLVGLDLNRRLIGWSKEWWPEVQFIHGDCTTVDLSIESGFDLVVSHMLVNHLEDPEFDATVAAVSRILRPEGKFVYMAPDPVSKATSLKIPDGQAGMWKDELAPWGGEVRYHHRTVQHQVDRLGKYFGNVGYKRVSYADVAENTVHLLNVLRNKGSDPETKKRLFVVAQK